MVRVPYILFISTTLVLAGCAAGRGHGVSPGRPNPNFAPGLGTDPGFNGPSESFGPAGAPDFGPAAATFDDAGVVRITAVNGEYAPAHAAEVYVYPGDVVTLAADMFHGQGRLEAQRHAVEGFAWESTLGDRCVIASGVDCLGRSHFQANAYGVSFYVPRQMPASIRITVRAPGGASRSDQILLRNAEFDGRPHPARPVLESLEEYPDPKFDPNVALVGQGTWIAIGNTRYFAPSTYVVPGEEDWAPYRHGYWSWDTARGLTWDSYDPWGRVTDHYGVWRHHGTYGWVWLPFTDHHYQPHVVTIVEAGDDVGWYPYATGCDEFYRPAAREGFDDGFWLGYGIGTQLASFHVGFAIVPRASFTAPNVIDVMITNRLLTPAPAVLPLLQTSIVERRWFGHAGGDLNATRLGLERRLGRPMPVLENPLVASRGGARVFAPRALYPVPAESRAWAEQIAKRTGPPPIGTVAHPRGGAVDLVPPFRHNSGLVSPPIVRTKDGGIRGVVTAPTPAEVDPRHPTAPGARSRLTNDGAPAKALGYDPRQATPAAVIPNAVPPSRGPAPAPTPVAGPAPNAAAPARPPAPIRASPPPAAGAPSARDVAPPRDQRPARDAAPNRDALSTRGAGRDPAPARAGGPPPTRESRRDQNADRGAAASLPDSMTSKTNDAARPPGAGRR